MKRLERFYDVQPCVGRLVGGVHDGLQLTFGWEWPFIWRMPCPAPVITFDMWMDGDQLVPVSYPTYERTESVGDDGVRVYRYVGDR